MTLATRIDPDAKLDYIFDWSDWLGATETIASHTVAKTGTITIVSHNEAAGVVTVWVNGATVVGSRPKITCHIVTNEGRIDDRSITLTVEER